MERHHLIDVSEIENPESLLARVGVKLVWTGSEYLARQISTAPVCSIRGCYRTADVQMGGGVYCSNHYKRISQ